MPQIIGDLHLVYNPYADRAHCLVDVTGSASFSISQTIEQGKFIQDGDILNLPISYDEALGYNYLYAPCYNPGGPSLDMYFFITAYEYRNSEVTAVRISVDTIQTYLDYITRLEGRLARSHAPRYIGQDYTLTDGTTATRYIVNPDLYFAEDDASDNYVIRSKTTGTLSQRGNNLLLILNLSEDMIRRVGWLRDEGGTASLTSTRSIVFNPEITTTFKDGSPAYDSNGWQYSSFHTASLGVTATVDPVIESSGAYSTKYYRAFRTFLRADLEQETTEPAYFDTKSDICLKTTGRTQLIGLIVPFRSDEEITLTISAPEDTFNNVIGSTVYLRVKQGLDFLLWLGPLLADKIVSAISIPAFNTSNLPDSFITATLNFGVASVTCEKEGTELSEGEDMGDPFTSILTTGYIVTDLKDLSYILGGVNTSTSSLAYRIAQRIGVTPAQSTPSTSEGTRTLDKEAKLKLYPYAFTSFTWFGTNILYKYQDISPVVWCANYWTTGNGHVEVLLPFYCIDPLASQPTIYASYLGDKKNLLIYEGTGTVQDGAFANLNDSLGTLISDIEETGTILVSTQPTIGYGDFIQNTLRLVKLDEDSISYLPTCAVYQDSYQEYQNYSKALAVVQNEYSYKQAQITRDQSYVSGALNILGGFSSMALGAATGGLLGASAITGSAGTIAGGISTLAFAGRTYQNTTSYIANSQIATETSNASRPPSQTGGSSQGNAQAFTWGMSSYASAGSTEGLNSNAFSIISYSWPLNVITNIEQRFYRWGYSIPVDVVIGDDGTPALSELIRYKSRFFYIQFENVEVLSFQPSTTYQIRVPTIYRQDIAERLEKGVTFVINRTALGDWSTLELDYSSDNYDTTIPDHPLFNRWWNT